MNKSNKQLVFGLSAGFISACEVRIYLLAVAVFGEQIMSNTMMIPYKNPKYEERWFTNIDKTFRVGYKRDWALFVN